jgi:hypothetical protein
VDQDEKNFKILELVAETRKFEIGLFWNRSLFFWGFTTVAITAYGAAHHFGDNKFIEFAIACGGFICSTIWMLVNRSSKYWQKVWQDKAAKASREAVGCNLFQEPPRPIWSVWEFPWWSAHFSVSKLATAFSGFTGIVWVALAFLAILAGRVTPGGCAMLLVGLFTLGYALYVLWRCRPDPYQNSN